MTTMAAPTLLQNVDSYLAQAQSSPLHLEQFKSSFIERALRDVTSTSHDSGSATAMDPTNPLAVGMDVESQKEYFRQLKFQYLEQEAKRHFLFLITDSEPNGPTQRDNDELEEINAEKKALLKKTKAEIEEMRRETVELAEKNAKRSVTVAAQTAEIQAVQARIRNLELELSRLHATHPPTERLTATMAEEILDKQVVELQDVTEARDVAVAEAEAKRDEVARVAKEVLRLAREREKEEARALEVREGREGGDTKVDDLCRWYTFTIGMYKSLLGIQTIQQLNDNELHITYDVPQGPMTLAMQLDSRTKRLVDAMLLDVDIDISEAVALAVTSNDVPGLIADVLLRIRRGC